jgi:group I intron endonuclease
MAHAIIASGIYQIKNLVNGKVYIGSSVNIKARWNTHKSSLRKNLHHSPALQRAWNKYGPDAFEFSILEIVEDQSKIFERETHYVAKFNSANGRDGYNTLVVGGSAAGYRHSDEAREKMSQAQKSIPYEKRLEYCVSFKGKKHTEETKLKMSLNSKRVSPTEEQRLAISKVHKGKQISAEHRAIVGAATALKNKTPEMRAKVSAALKGRVFTPEWRAKLSAAAKARHAKASPHRSDDARSLHAQCGA